MQILVESISFHRKFYKLPESNKVPNGVPQRRNVTFFFFKTREKIVFCEKESFHLRENILSKKGITKFCKKLSVKVNLPVERNAKGKGGYYL